MMAKGRYRAAAAVMDDTDHMPSRIGIYYLDSGPIMQMWGGHTGIRLYRFVEGQAECYYTFGSDPEMGTEERWFSNPYGFSYISSQTGNPIGCIRGDSPLGVATLTYEWQENKWQKMYATNPHTFDGQDDSPYYYSYEEDRIYSYREYQQIDHGGLNETVEQDYVLLWNVTSGDLAARVLERLADFFLHLYQPVLPEGAPVWVAEYVRHYRMQHEFSYTDDAVLVEPGGDGTGKSRAGFTLYPPFIGDFGVPLLSGHVHGSGTVGWPGSKHYLVDGNLHSLPPEIMTMYRFLVDAAGNVAITKGDEGGTYSWYRPGLEGLIYLFADGLADPGMDDESWEEYKQEMGKQLQAYGYTGWPEEILQGKDYYFPQEGLTWPEFEAVLIEFFCDYARELGQMA